MGDWPKACSRCGATIHAHVWAALPFVGLQDDGQDGFLQLRNHDCGTTLAARAPAGSLTEALRWELARLFLVEADAIERASLQRAEITVEARLLILAEGARLLAEGARLRDVAKEILEEVPSSADPEDP